MLKFASGFAALLLLACGASAQVVIEVSLEQNQFLSGEPVQVAVRITNRSGRVLKLGEQPDWLTFSLECQQVASRIVPRTGDVPVEGAFDLPSSKRAVKRVDLSPYFSMQTPGKYTVVATVRIPGWDTEAHSPPVAFYVIEGTRIWEREVGIPNASTNGVPVMHKFTLQQANNLRGQPRLYLRVTDSTGLKLIRLQEIGTILSFSRPDPQVDSESNLHLLYQNGPVSFGYMVYDPDGELILRQTYDFFGESKPHLTLSDKGYIIVTGGKRRPANNDFPPGLEPNTDPLVLSTAPPAPATTNTANAK